MNSMIYSILSVNDSSEKLNTLLCGMKGISGVGLSSVSFNNISAIVGDINRSELIADKFNAIEYAGVIETLAQKFTLLPMRYGSIMESKEAICKMLAANYVNLEQNLQKVENKIEFGLKVFCDSEKLMAKYKALPDSETKTILNTGNEIKNSVYKDWVNRKLKDHRIEELLLAHINSIIKEIEGYLTSLNGVFKFKKMITATNIIDAVILLEKDKKDTLINTVRGLQNVYPDSHILLTGPWPPYNFVDIIIK